MGAIFGSWPQSCGSLRIALRSGAAIRSGAVEVVGARRCGAPGLRRRRWPPGRQM